MICIFEATNLLSSSFKDLFISIIGALIGAAVGSYFTYHVAKWELKEESKRELDGEREKARIYFEQVKSELEDNIQKVKRMLNDPLSNSDAREDFFIRSIEIADSFSFFAYHSLRNIKSYRFLQPKIEIKVFESYELLNNLTNMLKRHLELYKFYKANFPTEYVVTSSFNECRVYAKKVTENVEETLQEIKNVRIK